MEGLTLFCNGIGCLMRECCHRYVDGRHIDPKAEGYQWMAACDDEERNGYMPMKR